MLKNCLNFLTSLRLTVVLLGLALILVFVGTLSEVQLGLYQAQAQIFRSFFVYWSPAGSHLKIPVFPGGWFIGMALLINLLAAHVKRFQISKKKIGILLIHAGLIVLLLGQFLTESYQIESQMVLDVGGSKNYTEDSRRHELAVMDVTDPANDKVVTIPETLLASGVEIQPPGLPFTLHVKNYLKNSEPTFPMDQREKIQATQGIGQHVLLTEVPEVKTMDDEDKPAALVEVVANGASLGNWTESIWFTSRRAEMMLQDWIQSMEKSVNVKMGVSPGDPQRFTVGGHTYELALRMVRYYKPYTIRLISFTHDTYAGTDTPSNFASKIHLSDPAHGEDRDVLIRMNSPLRYGGETFYQASFLPGDQTSILEVVKNPAAITPYLACSLVAVGLVTQFLMHLFGFFRKRAQVAIAPVSGKKPGKIPVPALAGKRSAL